MLLRSTKSFIFSSIVLELLSNIRNSPFLLFLPKACNAKFTPQIEFNLNLFPLLGSLIEIKSIGLLNFKANFRINSASVNVD